MPFKETYVGNAVPSFKSRAQRNGGKARANACELAVIPSTFFSCSHVGETFFASEDCDDCKGLVVVKFEPEDLFLIVVALAGSNHVKYLKS